MTKAKKSTSNTEKAKGFDPKCLIAPALWIAAFQAIGYALGMLTRSNMEWYHTLEKAALNPPDFVFPVVWSMLYVLLALAGWLMWNHRNDKDAGSAFRIYWMQMALNWGWTVVFFEWKFIDIATAWIAVLVFAMIAFMISAWKISRPAALLVLPTILWASFAGYLNYMIWQLN